MRPRSVLAGCAALALTGELSPAVAAPKKPAPVCHLLTDAKDDGYAQAGGAVLRSPAMDIHGADVATGKRDVVVVLRLATTESANDPAAVLGMRWNVNFKVRGTQYSFERRRMAGADDVYVYGAPGSSDQVKVAETKTEVRWTVPRAAIPELKKPRSVLENLAATNTVFTFNGDAATSPKKYVDLTPSCLRPA